MTSTKTLVVKSARNKINLTESRIAARIKCLDGQSLSIGLENTGFAQAGFLQFAEGKSSYPTETWQIL